MIYIKNAQQIQQIQAAANLWKQVRVQLDGLIVKNATGLKLSQVARQLIEAAGGTCAFKGYQDFPGEICVSVNEAVIHGIPNNRPFRLKDKVSVDIGVSLNGVVCDSGFTKLVDPEQNLAYQKLIDHNYQALWAGIRAVKPGNWTGDVAWAIESYVKNNCPEYSIVEDFIGHGCGLYLHELPHVFNFGLKPKTGTKLVPGMIICIEPMLSSLPTGAYFIDPQDKWTVKVKSGGQVCHWEHMVLVTETGCHVLTALEEELKNLY